MAQTGRSNVRYVDPQRRYTAVLGPSWNAPFEALPHDDRAGTHDSADGRCRAYASIGRGQAPTKIFRRYPQSAVCSLLGRSLLNEAALAELESALHTDLPWVREHTRLGELARRWDEQGRRNSATLRGADLDAAERWLDRRPADANAPTDLHQAFIRASRRAATARQRMWVGGSLAVAILAIGLAVFAEINRRDAQAQRDRAERTLTLATRRSPLWQWPR
jgi:hypothetical protein